jgi:hypothetical protein
MVFFLLRHPPSTVPRFLQNLPVKPDLDTSRAASINPKQDKNKIRPQIYAKTVIFQIS